MADQHPLRAALPPVNDYFDYLVAVEEHITKENLPVLHNILQDTNLTSNIGWDLVQTLLPLLPESEECMQDIARLGNPREVILKVTEALRIMEFDDQTTGEDEDETQEKSTAGPSTANDLNAISSPATESFPLPVTQFRTLLSMLSVLHPRVKTKFPSRFLSTSLQAVLASYCKATSHFGDLTGSLITFLMTLSGTKRPQLPPRKSSSIVPTTSSHGVAQDPEAQSEDPSAEELHIVKRLLQAFLTHVMEEYLHHLTSDQDIPGLAWSSRIHEKFNPGMVVPGKPTFTDRFAKDEKLQHRSSIVSQIVALGRELGLDTNELYRTIIENVEEPTGHPADEDDPPSSAADIPISKTGALYFFTARTVAKKLFDNASGDSGISIFPQHASILQNFLSAEPPSIGIEPEPLIDALLVLGIIALEDNDFGEPEDDEQFTKYLQLTSLLSANTPSPSLRYHAHLLTSTVLRSHPADFIRLSFIRDTLEHCPYENLKASAVGWLKGETLEAAAPALGSLRPGATQPGANADRGLGISETHEIEAKDAGEVVDDKDSVFATPIALSTVAPFVFPDLSHDLTAPSLAEAYATFKANVSFYLAALNFYYLLVSAEPLHALLDVPGLHSENDIGGSFLGPLREASKRFKEGLKEGGELREEEGAHEVEHGLLDLRLLDDVLERVEKGVVALN